jgi:hypothetical protein
VPTCYVTQSTEMYCALFYIRLKSFLVVTFQKKIVALSKEMDFAVNRYKALEQQNMEQQQRLLNSKLKRKGHLLLQPK